MILERFKDWLIDFCDFVMQKLGAEYDAAPAVHILRFGIWNELAILDAGTSETISPGWRALDAADIETRVPYVVTNFPREKCRVFGLDHDESRECVWATELDPETLEVLNDAHALKFCEEKFSEYFPMESDYLWVSRLSSAHV